IPRDTGRASSRAYRHIRPRRWSLPRSRPPRGAAQARTPVDDALTGIAGADADEYTRAITRGHEDVLRPGRAVHEVPRLERTLFALDEEEELEAQHEEVLLPLLCVVVAV